MNRSLASSRRPARRVAVAVAAALTVGLGTWSVPAQAAPAVDAVAVPSARLADPAADLALRARTLIARGMTGDARSMIRYTVVRNALADTVATRLGVSPASLKSAWRRASLTHQHALMSALSQLGVPYRRMTSIENEGFDCSGLTYFAWATAGVQLTRSSGTQIAAASPRTYTTAQAGDLVQYPGHVMMYLGVPDAIIHSPYTGRWVEVRRLDGDRSVRLGDPTA